MGCACIDEMNAKLADYNTKLGLTLGFGRDGSTYTFPCLHTEKIEKRVRKGPAIAVPSFCPFCGEKYKADDPTPTQEPSHGQ